MWLRRAAEPSGAVIVAAGATDPSVVRVPAGSRAVVVWLTSQLDAFMEASS